MAFENSPKLSVEIRYSPRPLSDYKAGRSDAKYGPATSAMLTTTGAWNLAYLSCDYDRTLIHTDPQFTVNVRRTTQMKLDESGLDMSMNPVSGVVESLLHLPAPRFVYLISRHPVLVQLPMYQAYGHAWLKTIEERSNLCQVDGYQPDDIADCTLALAELQRIRLV